MMRAAVSPSPGARELSQLRLRIVLRSKPAADVTPQEITRPGESHARRNHMSAVLVIVAFLSLLVLVFAYSRRKQAPPGKSQAYSVAPVQPYQGLFAASHTDAQQVDDCAEIARLNATRRNDLLARAAEGDCSTLLEAGADAALYGEVLGVLTERALNPAGESGLATDRLDELTAYILHAGLRADARLVGAALERWRRSPQRRRLAATLQLAALSDCAASYRKAVQSALNAWRAGALTPLTAAELQAAIESHYWLLSPEARCSGAGFVLKEFLAATRRELLAAQQPSA